MAPDIKSVFLLKKLLELTKICIDEKNQYQQQKIHYMRSFFRDNIFVIILVLAVMAPEWRSSCIFF